MKRLFAAFLAVAVLCSCTVTDNKRGDTDNNRVTAEGILQSSPLQGDSRLEAPTQVDILAMSPEMTDYLDEYVDRQGNEREKLAELLYAIIDDEQFKLAYNDSTRTAASTFRDRRGNCISFTNMFVAMARDLGLDARYQEVTIPPDWSMEGETMLVSQHVNVFVNMNDIWTRVVDFNSYSNDLPDEGRTISDRRARAHFFNNLGVEHMLEDESSQAYAYFRESLLNDARFSASWINLGILHRREGFPAHAEAAYLEALEHDRYNLVAMSNLANLYEEQGNMRLAEDYAARVRSHRMNNPYYRYQLANSAFADGDYESAIQDLKYAIRKRKNEDRFYSLLSLSYLMSGEKELAQTWMRKAEEVATETANKQKYHHKLDILMGMHSDS